MKIEDDEEDQGEYYESLFNPNLDSDASSKKINRHAPCSQQNLYSRCCYPASLTPSCANVIT